MLKKYKESPETLVTPQNEKIETTPLSVILNFVNDFFIGRLPQNYVELRKERADKRSRSRRGKQEAEEAASNLRIDGYGEEKHEVSEMTQTRVKNLPTIPEYCTFAKTRKNYEFQHWYYCYTCGLIGNEGCCSTCATTCHKGHNVVYCKKSSFFCDCSVRGVCTSLPPGF